MTDYDPTRVDDELKPIGWEWASDPRNPRALADDLARAATREPCPICGHPTGDCKGGHLMVEKKETVAAPTVPEPVPMEDSPAAPAVPQHVEGNRLLDEGAPDGKEVKASAILDSDGYVKLNVYEEVTTPLAKRKSYRLAYVKGQQLTREQAKLLKS